MATYNHFYDLPVYQKCRSFRENVSPINIYIKYLKSAKEVINNK